MIDQATQGLPQGRIARTSRVAGLIAKPAEPIADDMKAPLRVLQALIETGARQLAQDAIDDGAAWTKRLGVESVPQRERKSWTAHVATIALYRHRYGITGPSPIGDAKKITTAEQAAEYRAAHAYMERARQFGGTLQSEPDRHRPVSPRSL